MRCCLFPLQSFLSLYPLISLLAWEAKCRAFCLQLADDEGKKSEWEDLSKNVCFHYIFYPITNYSGWTKNKIEHNKAQ